MFFVVNAIHQKVPAQKITILTVDCIYVLYFNGSQVSYLKVMVGRGGRDGRGEDWFSEAGKSPTISWENVAATFGIPAFGCRVAGGVRAHTHTFECRVHASWCNFPLGACRQFEIGHVVVDFFLSVQRMLPLPPPLIKATLYTHRLCGWLFQKIRLPFLKLHCFKGAVSRDSVAFFYFMNRSHLGPWKTV